MHSIERYGIVALLFLIVTVVAVLMWDGGKEPGEGPGAGAASAKQPPAARDLTRDAESAAAPAARERRLDLVAEGRPGPLVRKPREDERSQDDALLLEDPAEERLELDEAEVETQTPREQLVPDDYIADSRVSAPVTPAAAPPKPAGRTYAVKAGDTLSEIAQRELGSSRRWPEIVAANPGLEPAKLRSGTTIRIPGAAPAAGAEAPRTAVANEKPETRGESSAAGAATWKVGKGENLWRIAERALGDGKRWGEIAKLNPDIDPDKLLLGQVLKLPAGAKGSGAAAKPAPATKPARGAGEPVVAQSSGERPRRGGKVK